MSDPRCGLHPRLVTEFIGAGLDLLTLDSPECLRSTLSIYISSLDGILGNSGLSIRKCGEPVHGPDRASKVLGTLDEQGVLVASTVRLGPGPYVARRG